MKKIIITRKLKTVLVLLGGLCDIFLIFALLVDPIHHNIVEICKIIQDILDLIQHFLKCYYSIDK